MPNISEEQVSVDRWIRSDHDKTSILRIKMGCERSEVTPLPPKNLAVFTSKRAQSVWPKIN